MERFDRNTHSAILPTLPFSYVSTDAYLEHRACVFLRNDEPIVVWQDLFYPHDFPSIFLPRKTANWECAAFSFVTSEEETRVRAEGIPIKLRFPIATEFFYRTDAFVQPTGRFRQKVERFRKHATYQVTDRASTESVAVFYERWRRQRKRTDPLFPLDTSFFFYLLERLDRYAVHQVYVLMADELVGLAWGMRHPCGDWVGLELKVDYRFPGLSQFLHHERAKLFSEYDRLTLGDGNEASIRSYKKELHPIEEREYATLYTGARGEAGVA